MPGIPTKNSKPDIELFKQKLARSISLTPQPTLIIFFFLCSSIFLNSSPNFITAPLNLPSLKRMFDPRPKIKKEIFLV